MCLSSTKSARLLGWMLAGRHDGKGPWGRGDQEEVKGPLDLPEDLVHPEQVRLDVVRERERRFVPFLPYRTQWGDG